MKKKKKKLYSFRAPITYNVQERPLLKLDVHTKIRLDMQSHNLCFIFLCWSTAGLCAQPLTVHSAYPWHNWTWGGPYCEVCRWHTNYDETPYWGKINSHAVWRTGQPAAQCQQNQGADCAVEHGIQCICGRTRRLSSSFLPHPVKILNVVS